MTAPKPEKPFVDELFEDLERRYKSPEPQIITGHVERFERLLNGALLPFVGVNAFLLGSIAYRGHVSSSLVPVVLSAALTIGWLALFPRASMRAAWLHIGGLATLALMAFLAIPNPLFASALGLAWTIAVAAAVLRNVLPEKAVVVYAVYLPLVISADTPAATRIAFEILSLVPMAGVFLASRLRVASLATLAGALLTGSLELSRLGQGNLGLAGLMGAFLIAAAVYEWRIPRAEVSSVRQFAGHALTMLLSFVAAATLWNPSQPETWWWWACAIALFQVFQMTRERLADPTRAAWVALAFVLCLWTQAPHLQWHAQVIGTLALAAAVHLLACATNRRFLATLALMLALCTAFAVVPKSDRESSVHVLAVCTLLVAFLLLAANTRPAPEALPWWRGFIRDEHADLVRRLSLGMLAQLLRIPFLSTLFAWLRSGFMWLKYLKGGAEAFSVSDLTFALAHVLAALLLGNQLAVLLVPKAAPSDLGPLIVSLVWVLWGLGLVVAGARKDVLFHRLLGTAFLGYPFVVETFVGRSMDEMALALLAIMTGLAMWLAGAMTRRVQTNAPKPGA